MFTFCSNLVFLSHEDVIGFKLSRVHGRKRTKNWAGQPSIGRPRGRFLPMRYWRFAGLLPVPWYTFMCCSHRSHRTECPPCHSLSFDFAPSLTCILAVRSCRGCAVLVPTKEKESRERGYGRLLLCARACSRVMCASVRACVRSFGLQSVQRLRTDFSDADKHVEMPKTEARELAESTEIGAQREEEETGEQPKCAETREQRVSEDSGQQLETQETRESVCLCGEDEHGCDAGLESATLRAGVGGKPARDLLA